MPMPFMIIISLIMCHCKSVMVASGCCYEIVVIMVGVILKSVVVAVKGIVKILSLYLGVVKVIVKVLSLYLGVVMRVLSLWQEVIMKVWSFWPRVIVN